MPRRYTNLRDGITSNEVTSIQQIKTTDINILLNRVKIDKKKTFKKKILVSTLLVALVCSLVVFSII
tara:strand:- start:109 stop:309 length:201 start_codon:yes stop_codon:yes gene_type:complete